GCRHAPTRRPAGTDRRTAAQPATLSGRVSLKALADERSFAESGSSAPPSKIGARGIRRPGIDGALRLEARSARASDRTVVVVCALPWPWRVLPACLHHASDCP